MLVVGFDNEEIWRERHPPQRAVLRLTPASCAVRDDTHYEK
jgi:hypothetical protein